MKKILSFLFVFALLSTSCAAPGTVGASPAKGLLEPVVARCDGYVATRTDIPKENVDAYVAAKAVVNALPSDKRVAAAQSWLSVSYISDFHDACVNSDANLDEVHKTTYLRSTALLRKMYLEAFKAEGRAPPDSRPVANLEALKFRECPDGSCGLDK